MKEIMKKALKWCLIILPIAVVGGVFTGIYTFEHFDSNAQKLALEQMGSYRMYLVASGVQSALYGVIASFIGVFLSNAVGLLKEVKFEKSKAIRVMVASIFFAAVMISDYYVLGRQIPQVLADYELGISPAYFMASLLYGGVIEEVLLRLFFMSLIVFFIWKLFARKYLKEEIPAWVYVSANVVSALVFSAGHLPVSNTLFGGLNALIIIRCFLLNGGLGLFFGRFYRKYGIQYAMEAHLLTHLFSKLVLMVVI